MKNFIKKFGFIFIIIGVCSVVAGLFIDPLCFTGAALALAPLGGLDLSQDEIEALAMSKLSENFGGASVFESNDGGSYENMALDVEDVYDGSEDDSISFQGNSTSFKDEADNGTEVTYTIVNDTSVKQVIALNNGDVTDLTVLKNQFGADGYLQDGTISTVGAAHVTGTGVGTTAGIKI